MALPSNTFSSYAAKGNREDLVDVIYRIDPTETPFVSAVDKTDATGVLHEWQTQALAAVAANAQLEGDDATTNAATATVRLGNVCQILTKTARVTGTQRVVKKAGRGDELDYQTMLKGLELKRDMEYNLHLNQAKNTGNTTTARTFAGILSWIKSNTNLSTAGSPADPAAADGTGTRTDGTQQAFTENRLKDVLAKCWVNGGKPDMIEVGSFNKQVMSTFTGRGTPVVNDSKTIMAAVGVYESDFGSLKIVPNRFMRLDGSSRIGREALVLQTDMWALAYLRNMKTVDLAKTGDSDQRELIVEVTLEARNEKASGIVADLTTA